MISKTTYLLAVITISYHTAKSQTTSEISSEEIKSISVKEYKKIIDENQKLILVYFHADWCVPCKKLIPVINTIQEENQLVLNVIKLNVQDNQLISEYFEINTLPLFMLYKNGKIVWTKNYLQTKQEISHQINNFK